MTASVGVLRRSFAKLMNVHNAQTVVSVGKAGRRPQPVRKREGDARRKHAKHISQGEQPPCLQSLRSGQTHEHSVLSLANQNAARGVYAETLSPPSANISPLGKLRGVAQTVCAADDRHQFRNLFPLVRFVAARCRPLQAYCRLILIRERKRFVLRGTIPTARGPLHCPPNE